MEIILHFFFSESEILNLKVLINEMNRKKQLGPHWKTTWYGIGAKSVLYLKSDFDVVFQWRSNKIN